MILGGDKCLSIELVNNWLIVSSETNSKNCPMDKDQLYVLQSNDPTQHLSVLNYEMSLHLQHKVKDSLLTIIQF